MCIQWLTFCAQCNTSWIAQTELCTDEHCQVTTQENRNRVENCRQHHRRVTPPEQAVIIEETIDELFSMNVSAEQEEAHRFSVPTVKSKEDKVKDEKAKKTAEAMWKRPFFDESIEDKSFRSVSGSSGQSRTTRASSLSTPPSSASYASTEFVADLFVPKSSKQSHTFGGPSIWSSESNTARTAFEAAGLPAKLEQAEIKLAQAANHYDELDALNDALKFRNEVMNRQLDGLSLTVQVLEAENHVFKAREAAFQDKIKQLEAYIQTQKDVMSNRESVSRHHALKHGLEKGAMREEMELLKSRVKGLEEKK